MEGERLDDRGSDGEQRRQEDSKDVKAEMK
jgi:hypothetical protein